MIYLNLETNIFHKKHTEYHQVLEVNSPDGCRLIFGRVKHRNLLKSKCILASRNDLTVNSSITQTGIMWVRGLRRMVGRGKWQRDKCFLNPTFASVGNQSLYLKPSDP